MSMKISGHVVRQLRLQRNWTQEHLAAVSGVAAKTIQRVENAGICSLETRSALAAVFQVESAQLEGQLAIEQAREGDGDELLFYSRLSTGNAVVAVFEGTLCYRYTHEDAINAQDVDLIADTIQQIFDWSEIWGDLDPGAKVRSTFELTELLQALEARGLWLFGLRTRSTFKMPLARTGNTQDISGSIGSFHLAYANSDRVIVLDPNKDAISIQEKHG